MVGSVGLRMGGEGCGEGGVRGCGGWCAAPRQPAPTPQAQLPACAQPALQTST